MNAIDSYIQIIAASLIIIISYFFTSLSRKTNIPSVLLLIILGVIIQQGMYLSGYKDLNFMPVLEVLGIVGLIMIVLEAALDLELKKEKWGIIWKSLCIALLSLGACSVLIAFIIRFFMNADFFNALIYAVPVSIMSSAIVIPSVVNLETSKKEFMVYESTFSDILGIMYFYFLIGSLETESAGELGWSIALNIILTIVISGIVSYGLIFIFQNLRSQVKFFMLIAVLLLLYSLGKKMHLSSLLIILVFGLVLHNHKVFFSGFLKRFKKEKAIEDIFTSFKLVTAESSFVVRTFFFVIFGMSISLASLGHINVFTISLLILSALYVVRIGLVRLFLGRKIVPLAFIAPRGLVTLLLFFSIPEELHIREFNPGILLLIIIVSSVVMAWFLIRSGKKACGISEIKNKEYAIGEETVSVTDNTLPLE